MDKKKIFTILENGEKKEYDVILTFKNEKNEKDYVVYTDNTYDDDNKLKIYAAFYNPLTTEFLGYVEDKEEWKEIIQILDNVLM